jgi:predicted O-linked N-acetylglucosamine transferase (SPINDLY family)
VSYEAAFDALKNGDFPAAVPLLEKAARETGFESDVINNAYTLALYRVGDKARLAEIASSIGESLWPHDPATAMDYFQRALTADLNQERARRIAELFEEFAAPFREQSGSKIEKVSRVAHIVGSLVPAHARTQYIKMLVASLRKQGIESTIFTTESEASWFFNPVKAALSQEIELDAEIKIASVEGDFVERADGIGHALRESAIQVAFFHAGLNDQISTRVAAMRTVPVQIQVNDGLGVDADLFDGQVHLSQNAMERSRFSHPAEWIPYASDIETRLQFSTSVTRQEMGLESASTISATFTDLHNIAGSSYLRVLTEIMNRFPKHFHLFVGGGNVRAFRSQLHTAGVLPRIRFLGQVSEVAPLMNVIDIYLAPFPHSGAQSILEAMGSGKPVVVSRSAPDSQYNTGAELVAVKELLAPGEGNYIEIADRLLRNPEFRAKQGQAMLDRFRAEFRPDRLGERYKAFLAPFQGAARG